MTTMTALTPINGCVLVELGQTYKNLTLVEGKFDTRTTGVVVSVAKDSTEYNYLLNKKVFFGEYKEGSRITVDSKIFSFIKIEDIVGYESV